MIMIMVVIIIVMMIIIIYYRSFKEENQSNTGLLTCHEVDSVSVKSMIHLERRNLSQKKIEIYLEILLGRNDLLNRTWKTFLHPCIPLQKSVLLCFSLASPRSFVQSLLRGTAVFRLF